MHDEATMSAQPVVVTGSDPRLQSEYGARRADALVVSGVAGDGHRVLYGPHVPVPPGVARFELTFEMQNRGRGLISVDLANAGEGFYLRRCFEWELQRGLIRISYPFVQSMPTVELRLYAGPGFEASFRSLAITPLQASDVP
jgi:hypothetical protein